MSVTVAIITATLSIGGMYGLAALGLGIMFRITRVLNVAFGSVMMIAGLILAGLVNHGSISPLEAVPLGLAIGVVLMYLVFALLYPMLGRGELVLILMTLGIDVLMGGLALVIWGGNEYTFPGVTQSTFHVAGTAVSGQSIVTFVSLLVIAFGIHFWYRFSMTGLALRAAASDEEGSLAVGIVHNRMMLVAVGLSGAIGGLAACFIVPLTSVDSTFGDTVSVAVIIAMVVGGFGENHFGAIGGGLVIGLLEALAIVYAPAWSDVFQFGLLIVAMTLRNFSLGERKHRAMVRQIVAAHAKALHDAH